MDTQTIPISTRPVQPANEHERLLEEWRNWLVLHRYAHLSVRRYVRSARNLFAAYPTVALEQLSAEHIERMLAVRPLSAYSYAHAVVALRPFFEWCRKSKRLIRSNPCNGVDVPKIRPKPRPAVLPEQFTRMCHAAPSLEALLAMHLMYFSGLRINELLNVRVGDADLERRLLRVREGKGARRSGPRERWTVIHVETARVLQLWLWRAVKLHPDLWLLGETRRKRAYKVVNRWMDEARQAAGLPNDVTPHSLRHGFAKAGKLRGVSIEVVAALMGHENLETTRKIYGALTPEEMREVYDRAMTPTGTGAPAPCPSSPALPAIEPLVSPSRIGNGADSHRGGHGEDQGNGGREDADTSPPLTEREREVLVQIAEGHTNQHIADQLSISIKTVQTHRANLMDKLGLHDRSLLARYAIRMGLIQP